jgi:hypothetical protein
VKFQVGKGWAIDGVLVPAGSIFDDHDRCPPPDACALDTDCAVLMHLTYKTQRNRLLRRLSPAEQSLFDQIIREFSEDTLAWLWGLKQTKPKPEPKPSKPDFAKQLAEALVTRQ